MCGAGANGSGKENSGIRNPALFTSGAYAFTRLFGRSTVIDIKEYSKTEKTVH